MSPRITVVEGKLPQDLVTWDQYSISVRGERIVFLAGEFHPFRLPSPGLWLDVFQKIRALGYSGVSFYLDWALLEGQHGHVRTDGIFALDKFFEAASEAGIYLIARPGPYINSEVSGGGFPGWLGRLKGRLKSTDQDYLDAITPYIQTIGRTIAKSQTTNGGPVVMFQPDNEYTMCLNTTGYTQDNNRTITGIDSSCLEKEHMGYVVDQFRKSGLVVPFIVNDAFPMGNFAPGSGVGAVDNYSFDNYPVLWAMGSPDPYNWSSLLNPLLLYNFSTHQQISPGSPMSISEFQGGVPDPWGGVGVDTSAAYINHEFERIFYKLNYGRIKIFGGTNWGNLGHPSGYTSYDVGAAIAENCQVSREKYSELKLQASFLQVSPDYLTAQPENGTFGVYTDTHDLVTTRLRGSPTNFYVVRHSDLTSFESTRYRLRVTTSIGDLSIPQLGGSLQLNGRDSKFHVVDYNAGGTNLIYSTAEILTWKRAGRKSVVVLYGGENEFHEFALPVKLGMPSGVEGDGLRIKRTKSAIVVQWHVEPKSRVLKFEDAFEIHLLWRNDAYNYWVLDLPVSQPLGLHVSPSRADKSVVVKGSYLLRNASISGDTLHLTGDLNATTEIEVISAPSNLSSVRFNGNRIQVSEKHGRLRAEIPYLSPNISLPDLKALDWRYLNSLPELSSSYDDSRWRGSNNPRKLSTPTSLYASDYGYHSGSVLYRGSFVADGSESFIYLLTEAGWAFGHSVWLDSTFLGSWVGSPADMFYNQTLSFPTKLQAGQKHVLTVLIDHMGIDSNFPANLDLMKDPRGILDYVLDGRDKSAISWKMTGNLGGERYRDLSRGPLNEGGIFPQRAGYHLPGTPTETWVRKSPVNDGLPGPGVGFFATSFDLHIPTGYDVPISIVFANTTMANTSTPAKFRSEIYVNGWQFGKYINHIGPQTRYPVPEGILNYDGNNYLAITLWSMEGKPVKLAGLELQADAVIQSGYRKPQFVEGQRYAERRGSY
ncbi:beta-galactosidase [Aspergillus steynii IBT 23096]|uniref:beta-galactosidase n=1 Tax=Aspergillus steynii IBT 23096 TaxID=1392250 RepID=A0A2I2GLC4_9EURO|nr:beta-galactosidase [Aspergillus steynii IBT 23096]PLB53681.1 beta-galactosidase [Aspergillus steynii IBT 23096]